MPRARTIYVFAKQPEPGRVKTRLIPRVGSEAAALLAVALLDDTLRGAARAARELDARLVLATSPDRPGPGLVGLARAHGAVIAGQGEGDLGRRLARVLGQEPGAARVVLGADVPDLPPGRLASAVAAVEGGAAAALGPAEDGGYHLLALAAGQAAAFLARPGIDWGGPRALEDTLAALGGRATLLDPWPDVDEPEDLTRLAARLRERPASAPATVAWLSSGAWRGSGVGRA